MSSKTAVLAHSVAERKHEIGIRIALGASRERLLWLMVRYSLKLLLPGLVVGVMLSRVTLCSGFLPVGLSAAPPISVYSTVISLLSVIALVATIGPAMWATKVDRTAVLRQ